MVLLGFLINFLFWGLVKGQTENITYSFDSYQKLDRTVYTVSNRLHSSLKPYLIGDSLFKVWGDTLLKEIPKNNNGLGNRKLFNEHLIQIYRPYYSFYADILPNFEIGRDFSLKQSTYTSSLGIQLGGSIGKKINYYFSWYENQAILPNYLTTYINQVGIVPGQASAIRIESNIYRWSYVTGLVSYTPNKYLNISAGIDKTFIGDGYRSLLLSDYSSPYPFLKLTGTLGNVRYMVMYTYMNDPAFTSQYGIDRKKFGVFHYLDWSISKRVSLGFFENIMGFFTDDNGAKRPFDLNYLNPIVFMKTINNASDNPDKSLLGLNSKYKITDDFTIYGQFALNDFRSMNFFSSNGAYDNKYGWQLGAKGTNLFKISGLDFLLETNNVKPYTYQARSAIENYSSNGEPLAHPWGANFREALGLLKYSIGKWNFKTEFVYGQYGLDSNAVNNGKDVFKIYNQYAKEYGNFTGQGISTNLVYIESKVTYLINPKTNLRIEFKGIYRRESNSLFNDNLKFLSFGIKSSFRNFYHDLASYKIK